MLSVTLFSGEDQVAHEVTDESVELQAMCLSGDRAWRLVIEVEEWNGLPRIKSVKSEDYVVVNPDEGR